MSEMILQVKNLSKEYKEFQLKNVNLELPRGFIMGFIGKNGAGKTTTIKAILNLIQRDSGDVQLFGVDPLEHEMDVKNRIGFVGENQYFYEDMSVDWTASFFRKIYRQWDDQLLKDLLTKFQISRKKRVKDLSKGMRVKLAFALALAHNPELLILDEPTSGLDPAARHDVLQEIQEMIKDERKSVFFSSHITQDIEKIADYVTFIDNGRILFSEEKDVLLDRFKKVVFSVKEDRGIEMVRPNFISLKSIGRSCVGITGSLDTLNRLKGDIITEMDIQRIDLDEIFIAHVKGEVS